MCIEVQKALCLIVYACSKTDIMFPLQTYLKTKDTAIILRFSCYFLVTVSISQSNSERKSISQPI